MKTKQAHMPTARDSGQEIFYCPQCESTVAIALSAPHKCPDAECPGNVNRLKLESLDTLLASHKRLLKALRRIADDLTVYCGEDGDTIAELRQYLDDCDSTARTAIAEAKEMTR